MKIVADQHIPYVQEYFSSRGDLILKPGRAINHADVRDAAVLLVRSVTKVNAALLQHSSVRFVGSVTAGKDHLDIEWLKLHRIAWQVAAGFNAPPVAHYVLSVIAALQSQGLLTSTSLTAAVIGVGQVGTLVVAILRALGFRVVMCDPPRRDQEQDFCGTPMEAIADVDLICLHVPLSRKGRYPTHHFINKAFLERQRPGCVLLNAARGAVIHSADLLSYGSHLVWCFDVWEHEPMIDNAILERAYIATPHIAGYSVESKWRGTNLIYQALCDFIRQEGEVIPVELPKLSISELSISEVITLEQKANWQEPVLSMFNPILLTKQMKAHLLQVPSVGEAFDAMRHQFQGRHELVLQLK